MSNYLIHFGRSIKDDPSLPIGTGNWRRDGSGGAKAEYKASKLDRKAAEYQRKAAELKRKSTRWFMPIDSEKAARKAAKYELKASKYSERASKIRTKEAKAKYKQEKLLATSIKDIDSAVNDALAKDSERPEVKTIVDNGFKQKHDSWTGSISYVKESGFAGSNGVKQSIKYDVDSEDANGKDTIKDFNTFVKDAPKIEKQIKNLIKDDKRMLDAIRVHEGYKGHPDLSDDEVKTLVNNVMNNLYVTSAGKDGYVEVELGDYSYHLLGDGHHASVEYDIRRKKMSNYVSLNG